MGFGKPKKIAVPGTAAEAQAPVATTRIIEEQAQAAGEVERRRLRGRRGRASTRLTTPGFLVPAQIERRGLKTKFG